MTNKLTTLRNLRDETNHILGEEEVPIFWTGGDEPPIPDGVLFRYWFRDALGFTEFNIGNRASLLRWDWSGSSGDIIAYAVIG